MLSLGLPKEVTSSSAVGGWNSNKCYDHIKLVRLIVISIKMWCFLLIDLLILEATTQYETDELINASTRSNSPVLTDEISDDDTFCNRQCHVWKFKKTIWTLLFLVEQLIYMSKIYPQNGIFFGIKNLIFRVHILFIKCQPVCLLTNISRLILHKFFFSQALPCALLAFPDFFSMPFYDTFNGVLSF